MDHFLEEVVVKRKRGMSNVLFMLSNVVMIVSAVLAVSMLQMLFIAFDVISLVITLLFAGVAVLLFMRRDRLRTEYEYTFTNGELDFAQVFNNQKRKALGTMRVKNVESFGPVDSNQFRKLVNMQDMKRRNWFLNRDANLYYFYYQKETAKNMIIFEPSEEMVDMIRKYLAHGVYQE